MGYAQELERRMSSFSNFAVSFSIICILSGGINSLAQATSGAGGAAIGIGWPLGCFISLVFAVAMAQISSAYPTAGGLYHWGSILGNRFTGWLTAWFNLLGLVTVLGAINVGTYYFFMGSFGTPYFGLADTTYGSYRLPGRSSPALQALVNHMGIGLTAKLTDFSGYLIFATAIALAVGLPVGGAVLRVRPPLHLRQLFRAKPAAMSGPPPPGIWVFLLGLLLPIYTITGYDASAHTSEETVKAAAFRSARHGLLRAVVGALRLHHAVRIRSDAARTWTKPPSRAGTCSSGRWTAQVNPVVKDILYLAILVSQWLCGLATVTSVSRMIFAFSRDGGLPASKALSKVSPKYRTPVAAIWTGSILSVLFVWGSSLVSIGDTPVYTIVVSCTVIFLFFSFAIPITLGLFAWGTSKWDKMGPWNLGEGMFKLFAVLSIIAMILIFVLGIQPPNDWALYITVGFLVLTAIVWFGFENRRFKGPPIGDEVARAPG